MFYPEYRFKYLIIISTLIQRHLHVHYEFRKLVSSYLFYYAFFIVRKSSCKMWNQFENSFCNYTLSEKNNL